MIYLPSVVSVARVSVILCVLFIALLCIQDCRIADRDARIAVQTAEKAGWTVASGKPTIPDLPHGSKPVAVASGGIRYLPRRTAPGPRVSSAPPHPPAAAAAGGVCDLNSLTVDVDCRMELATASGVPVAKLWVHTLLSDGERTRDLPWHRVGDPLTIRMPDGGEQPVVTTEPEVKAKLPPPIDRFSLGLRRPSAWRTGWVAGVGVSYDPVVTRTAPAAFVGYGLQF